MYLPAGYATCQTCPTGHYCEATEYGNCSYQPRAFYNEEEKNTIQNTVYGIVDELSVDTESYKTGEIQLTNVVYDNSSTAGDSISQEKDSRGRMIKFTAEYSYTWEYKSDAYEDSGIDSAVAKGLILLDYINGSWCIRELYLPLRKTIH